MWLLFPEETKSENAHSETSKTYDTRTATEEEAVMDGEAPENGPRKKIKCDSSAESIYQAEAVETRLPPGWQ
jgi:hypothetical protein